MAAGASARLSAALGQRYAVERELGRGGMASVWLARDLLHQRPVALKVLHPELAGAIGVDRFVREIRLTAGLRHPNIVPVLDSGLIPGDPVLPWFAMAYVPGESLQARLAREHQLPVDEAVRIAEQAAAALEAAHRQGIVHRDIKPGNLLLAGSEVYVADFGIAKALLETGAERLTSTGLALGTPAYMSPEQSAAQPVDPRTDQYSLACVLYEMLLGEAPFTGPTAQAIVARRMTEPARAIRPVRPSVPPAVEAAVLRALERVPADRFADTAAFAAALRSTATTVPVTAAPPAAGRRWPVRLAGAAIVALAVAGAVWFRGDRGGTPRPPRDAETVALYRRGLREYERRTPEGAAAAVRSFSAALARDSNYAEAWAALGRTYNRAFGRRYNFPGIGRDSVLRLAVWALDRALALDPRNADVWVTQAAVTRSIDPTDHTSAERAVAQALVLDSTAAGAWFYRALDLAEAGRMDAALEGWRRTVALDPRHLEGLAFLALGHYWQRQYDSAQRWVDSAVAIDPGYLLARTAGGAVAVELGRPARARAGFEAARRLSTDVEVVNAWAGLALAEARAGAVGPARTTLARAQSLATFYDPAPLHTAVYLAHAYAALGDADRAIAWVRRYEPREDLHFQLHLRCDPPFDPIARDPRYRALLTMPRPPAGEGC